MKKWIWLMFLLAPRLAWAYCTSPCSIVANINDGALAGGNAVYATARTTAITVDTTLNESVGQYNVSPNYSVLRYYLQFDTSTTNIPADATINSVTMRLVTHDDVSGGTSFDLQIRDYNWTPPLSIGADFLGCINATLDAVLCTTTTNCASAGNYTTSAAMSPAAIQLGVTAATRYCLTSSLDASATAPGVNTNQYWRFYSAENAGFQPLLVVDWSPAGTATPTLTPTATRTPTSNAATPTRLPTFTGGTPPRCGEIGP